MWKDTRHSGHGAAPEFKEAVKLFVSMHDQVAQRAKELCHVRKQKSELAEVILEYMVRHNIDGCVLGEESTQLVRKQTKRVEPLRKEHIMGELAKVLSRREQAEDVLESIFSNRAVRTKDSLHLTKRKAG